MAISQKRTPTVTDVNTQRALQQVYEDINELINAINKGDTSDKRISNTGKSGDIHIRKTANKEYILELRTDEGWVVSTNSTPTGFKFQNKTEDDTGNTELIGNVTVSGQLIADRPSAVNLAAAGEIPITSTYANIDPNGADRTGIKFAGAGTAGQILIVENSGAEALTFNNTESTALLRGIDGAHDTMPANFVGLFVSDGARWNIIAGGIDTQPDVGLTAP